MDHDTQLHRQLIEKLQILFKVQLKDLRQISVVAKCGQQYTYNFEMFEIRIVEPTTDPDIFFDAVANADYLDNIELFENPKLHQFIRNVVDDSSNNLLHTACALNKSDYIRGLIGVGCRLSAKNTVDSTPLHIAIEEHHSDCIDKFVEIISDISLFPGLADDLVRLFTVYNRHGYTVLHLAVLNGCEPLVRALLEFARSHNIAACAIQELTNGKTIAHLAMMKGNLALARLFATYDPMACYYKNYERLNCYDMNYRIFKNLTLDNLKIKRISSKQKNVTVVQKRKTK